jgi:hypothetical protein
MARAPPRKPDWLAPDYDQPAPQPAEPRRSASDNTARHVFGSGHPLADCHLRPPPWDKCNPWCAAECWSSLQQPGHAGPVAPALKQPPRALWQGPWTGCGPAYSAQSPPISRCWDGWRAWGWAAAALLEHSWMPRCGLGHAAASFSTGQRLYSPPPTTYYVSCVERGGRRGPLPGH